jgi:hypothetical protein
LDNHILTLRVNKSPILVRFMMYFFAAISFLVPLTGIVVSMASGYGLHIGMFFGLVVFGLIGFYLLRSALWNTYGEELIDFSGSNIEYQANYGWFKDKIKSIGKENLEFSNRSIGYEEDNAGALVIKEANSNSTISTATKIPNDQIEDLIHELVSLVD